MPMDKAAKATYDAEYRKLHRAEIRARQAKWNREQRAKHGLKPKISIEERFWSKVEKTDTCWLWRAAIGAPGYGMFGIGSDKVVGAHRFSFELANGPIPEGMSVLHKCDVRPCVRPDHLFLGTQQDNIDDAIAKGRLDPGGNKRRARGL